MSTHTLVLTIEAERFSDLENEVAHYVARWCGWSLKEAAEKCADHEAEVVPVRTYQRARGRGFETRVVYRATVKVTV